MSSIWRKIISIQKPWSIGQVWPTIIASRYKMFEWNGDVYRVPDSQKIEECYSQPLGFTAGDIGGWEPPEPVQAAAFDRWKNIFYSGHRSDDELTELWPIIILSGYPMFEWDGKIYNVPVSGDFADWKGGVACK